MAVQRYHWGRCPPILGFSLVVGLNGMFTEGDGVLTHTHIVVVASLNGRPMWGPFDQNDNRYCLTESFFELLAGLLAPGAQQPA